MIKLLKTAALVLSAVPAVAVPNSTINRLGDVALSDYDREQIRCLAANIYYEARSETPSGKELVALVTLNRSKATDYPNSICEVVTEKRKARGRYVCQFSWYCEKGKDKKFHSRYLSKERPQNYDRVYSIARSVYLTYSFNPSYSKKRNILFYHADYVSPKWDFSKLRKVVSEGKHIFYELKRKQT